MPDPVVVSVSRHFAASQDQVFDAWLRPDSVRQWLFATEQGEIVRAEVDPHVGGRFLITDRRNGEDVDHHGVYVSIERPRQLEFTFVAGKPDGDESRVIVHTVPTEHGCELTLTHVMEPQWADFREHSARAWTDMLAGLAKVVERADDAPAS